MIIVILLSLSLYCFLFKIWKSGVKAVGRGIIFITKPTYKFLVRILPLTMVIATVISILLAVGVAISMVKGNGEDSSKKEKTENEEVIEDLAEDTEKDVEEENDKQEEEKKFYEKFGDRALKRMDKFSNFLMRKIASLNKAIGMDEDGEYTGSSGFLIAYAFFLLILLPFMFVFLVIAFMWVLFVELFVITLIIDAIILGIRLYMSHDVKGQIRDWWEWATE